MENDDLGLPVRFWSKVNKQGSVSRFTPHLGPCWEWTAGLNTYRREGYGRFWLNGRSVLAHRMTYEATHGPIPAGLTIDHLCRNTICVRPLHLEAVTSGVNRRRGFTERERLGEYTPRDVAGYQREWQRQRATDPEWRARRAAAARERWRERYRNDPEFRERCKAKARAVHRRKGQRPLVDDRP